MPEITRFYGLVVWMNFRNREHNPPHIHVGYGDKECSIELLTCTVHRGKLPPKATEMAIEWAAKNQKELLEMWETQNITKLPPLL